MKLVGSAHGKILERGYLIRLFSQVCPWAIVFAQIGDIRLALPINQASLNENLEDEDPFLHSETEPEEEDPADGNGRSRRSGILSRDLVNDVRELVNEKLSTLISGSNYEQEHLRTQLLSAFPGKEIIAFRFGRVVRHKARLVALGYKQKHGIDFHETFV